MTMVDKKQAAGFMFAGAMIGATVALLCAPQSGARTRRDLRKFGRDAAAHLDDFQGDVADWVGDMTEAVKEGVAHGKRLGTEGYEQVLRSFDSAKKCVEDGRNHIAELIKTA